MLESAEFTPGGVEFAGHAEELFAECPAVRGGEREVVVSPAAGRQRLKLKMGVDVGKIAAAAADMPGVVEDGKSRLNCVGAYPAAVFGVAAEFGGVCPS